MSDTGLVGILTIGDPHLASRTPGFRKDEYPETILKKLEWCLSYARDENLVPVMLGDLFHFPRHNANWLLSRLMVMLEPPLWAIAGNHDHAVNELEDDDSVMVLVNAGRLRLLDAEGPQQFMMNGRRVTIGGTTWGKRLPKRYPVKGERGEDEVVVWVGHADVAMPGYEESARVNPREIPGVDLVVNGHIHRPLETVVKGATTWMNPGNITRVTRGDASLTRTPHVLRIDVTSDSWTTEMVEVPHAPFEDVFYESLETEGEEYGDSQFVSGLKDLEAHRTDTGAGLRAFLDNNLPGLPDAVATEIRRLAEEVIDNG